MTLDAVPRLDVDPLLDDPATRIIVCCGAGGVGKTTTAAALGVRAAERGRKTVVLTIDPARRLAQSMGIASLDNVPRRVEGLFAAGGSGAGGSGAGSAEGDSAGGGSAEDGSAEDGSTVPGDAEGGRPAGELHAMMLDMKRTFDEIVVAHADAERARAILENPFYQSLSAGFAGTQEYMAMEKLGQLRARDEWDLIIVDTPPSRSALDFLDAPKRLGSFLDGKFIRVLMAPAKVGGRAGMKFLNAGMSVMTGTLSKLMGGQLLRDVQTFVAAMDTMFGGFRTRADATYRLLQAPGTAFLVVAAPERDALREAAYFVERLAAEDMPLAGLVLNRVHGSGAARLSAERAVAAAETLEAEGSPEAGEPPEVGKTPESENLATARMVDQGDGETAMRAAESLGDGAPAGDSPTAEGGPVEGARAADGSSDNGPGGLDRPSGLDRPAYGGPDVPEGLDASGPDAPARRATADRLAAGLLRLHAERMQVLGREQHNRDRFTALHPDVPVAEVSALPGDVHDLAGLRAIGERLAADNASGAA